MATRPLPFQLRRVRADHPDAVRLIAALDADLLARYPASAVHGLHPGDAENPGLVFLLAYLDTEPIACGALRPLEPGAAEVKRLYVVPERRMAGISRAVLAALEAEAKRRGDRILRVETGARQPESLGLFRSSGYFEIPAFGEYPGNPHSVCFEKRLDESRPEV